MLGSPLGSFLLVIFLSLIAGSQRYRCVSTEVTGSLLQHPTDGSLTFGKKTMSPDTPTHTLFSLMLRDGHISGQGDVVILAGRVSWSSLGGEPRGIGIVVERFIPVCGDSGELLASRVAQSTQNWCIQWLWKRHWL